MTATVRSVRRGVRLEQLTVGRNAIQATVAIAAGVGAGLVALVGFGSLQRELRTLRWRLTFAVRDSKERPVFHELCKHDDVDAETSGSVVEVNEVVGHGGYGYRVPPPAT